MRARGKVTIVITLLTIATASILFWSSPPSHPEVCAVLYVWYGYNFRTNQWTGGNGTSHWNDSPVGVVKDTPADGYYASYEEIPTQLHEMQSLGIDCAIVSWWGPAGGFRSIPDRGNGYIDLATMKVFQTAASMANFKVGILVDAFLDTVNASQYQDIYDYIWSDYYQPYSNLVVQWDGKPLLVFFNPMAPQNLGVTDSRFTTRVTGNNANQISSDWWWFRGESQFFQASYGIQNPIPPDYLDNGISISPDGFTQIAPRFDSYYLHLASGHDYYMRMDVNYTEGEYSSRWGQIISHSSAIKIVLIYSWNEYHERSEIELHSDYTAHVGTDYLASLTASYVTELG